MSLAATARIAECELFHDSGDAAAPAGSGRFAPHGLLEHLGDVVLMTAGRRGLQGATVDIPQVGAARRLEVGDHDTNHSARLEDPTRLQQKSARDRAVEMLED